MNPIVAVDEAWGIGRNGGLLTHLPGDMKYFRETTRREIVVIGRKTLESFPDAKLLKNRANIMLTRNWDYCPEGATVCHDINEILETLKQYLEEDIFIMGGGMIYGEFPPYCKETCVTCIHGIFQADTKFADLDREKDWEWEYVGEMQEYNGLAHEFRIYIRRQQE